MKYETPPYLPLPVCTGNMFKEPGKGREFQRRGAGGRRGQPDGPQTSHDRKIATSGFDISHIHIFTESIRVALEPHTVLGAPSSGI